MGIGISRTRILILVVLLAATGMALAGIGTNLLPQPSPPSPPAENGYSVTAVTTFDANFSQINQARFAADYRDVVGTMAPGALSIAVSLRAGSVIATAAVTYGADARSANETSTLRREFTQSRLTQVIAANNVSTLAAYPVKVGLSILLFPRRYPPLRRLLT